MATVSLEKRLRLLAHSDEPWAVHLESYDELSRILCEAADELERLRGLLFTSPKDRDQILTTIMDHLSMMNAPEELPTRRKTITWAAHLALTLSDVRTKRRLEGKVGAP